MSTPAEADRWFAKYGISDVVRISDPEKTLYRQFGLADTSLATLFDPRVVAPWFRTAILGGHGAGMAGPNWRQRSGAFLIHRDRILVAQRYPDPSERPDYVALIERGIRARQGPHEEDGGREA